MLLSMRIGRVTHELIMKENEIQISDSIGYTRITLRIPSELDRQLDAVAKETSKSKNAEIIARLSSTFEGREGEEVLRAIVADEVAKAVQPILDMLRKS